MAPAFYEFFCGGGMARAGLEPDWRALFANDVDPRKAAAYAANWGREGLVVADVASLTARDLPSSADLAWASRKAGDWSSFHPSMEAAPETFACQTERNMNIVRLWAEVGSGRTITHP